MIYHLNQGTVVTLPWIPGDEFVVFTWDNPIVVLGRLNQPELGCFCMYVSKEIQPKPTGQKLSRDEVVPMYKEAMRQKHYMACRAGEIGRESTNITLMRYHRGSKRV